MTMTTTLEMAVGKGPIAYYRQNALSDERLREHPWKRAERKTAMLKFRKIVKATRSTNAHIWKNCTGSAYSSLFGFWCFLSKRYFVRQNRCCYDLKLHTQYCMLKYLWKLRFGVLIYVKKNKKEETLACSGEIFGAFTPCICAACACILASCSGDLFAYCVVMFK